MRNEVMEKWKKDHQVEFSDAGFAFINPNPDDHQNPEYSERRVEKLNEIPVIKGHESDKQLEDIVDKMVFVENAKEIYILAAFPLSAPSEAIVKEGEAGLDGVKKWAEPLIKTAKNFLKVEKGITFPQNVEVKASGEPMKPAVDPDLDLSGIDLSLGDLNLDDVNFDDIDDLDLVGIVTTEEGKDTTKEKKGNKDDKKDATKKKEKIEKKEKVKSDKKDDKKEKNASKK